MKFRNRFLKYGSGVSRSVGFQNFNPVNKICFADDDNDDDNKGGTVTLSKEELQTMIADSVSTALKAKDQDQEQDKSNFDKLKDEDEKTKQTADREAEIRSQIKFDAEFDSIIKNNSKAFSLSAERIRQGAGKLEGDELIHSLSCTASKDFFSKKENLELLSEGDKIYVEESVLNCHDKEIDAKRAWALVESALHIANRLKTHDSQKNKSNNYDETDAPHVSAYLKRCREAGSGDKSVQH